jgi:hypothetical protein
MLSTAIELAGFSFITYAAYGWHHLVGWLVGGLFLVVIGYSVSDNAAVIAVARVVHPVTVRWQVRKVRRAVKKAG